jgi:hypothetical protein
MIGDWTAVGPNGCWLNWHNGKEWGRGRAESRRGFFNRQWRKEERMKRKIGKKREMANEGRWCSRMQRKTQTKMNSTN